MRLLLLRLPLPGHAARPAVTDQLFDAAEYVCGDFAAEPEQPGCPPQPAGQPCTERDLLAALHHRYSYVLGNGRRYVVAEQVRSHASFDARRTADFIALDTWKSSNFALHGHEVKVSRSDWLRELKEPEKAAEFIPYLNYWWVVVPAPAIVKTAELPDWWGLMTLAGGQLRALKRARRQEAAPLTMTRMVALMRAVQRTAALRGQR
jgi:hypothetical protein